MGVNGAVINEHRPADEHQQPSSPLQEAYWSACREIDRLAGELAEARRTLARGRNLATATLALARDFTTLLESHGTRHLAEAAQAREHADDWLEGFHQGGADQCQAQAAVMATFVALVEGLVAGKAAGGAGSAAEEAGGAGSAGEGLMQSEGWGGDGDGVPDPEHKDTVSLEDLPRPPKPVEGEYP